MNIHSYLAKYKDTPFKELEFNEIDSLILSEFSYTNLDLYVPRFCDDKFISLSEIDIVNHKEFIYGSVDAKKDLKLFNLMSSGSRYKDLKIGLYRGGTVSKDDNKTKQFFAVTYLLSNHTLYIAFRGTDITINGWKEDFHLCFMDTIPSQIEALEYTKKVLKKYKLPFYLGGHSKGGNLAFYAALNLDNKRFENRLIKAYSFDGPGFKDGIKHFPSYKNVRNKLVKYMTNRDFVGMIYNNQKRGSIIISATGVLLGGHDPYTWKVDVKKHQFVRGRRNKVYRNSEIAFNKWLDAVSQEDKILACDMIFDLLKNTKTVLELPRSLANLFIHRKELLATYSDSEKERVKALVKNLIKVYFEINFKRKRP